MLSRSSSLTGRTQHTTAPKIFTLSTDEARSKVREIINPVPRSRPQWRTWGSLPGHGLKPQDGTSLPQTDRRGTLTSAKQFAEVRVRRHGNAPDCDVVVTFRGKETLIRCRNYDQATKWARIECRSYGIASGFVVES